MATAVEERRIEPADASSRPNRATEAGGWRADGQPLRAFIRDHHVSWEMAPHVEQRGSERVPVGVDLCLFATPPAGCGVDPGCPGCVAVWESLRELVERVVPPRVRVSVDPFDASFRLRSVTEWTPEVECVAEMLHRGGTFEPLDAVDRRLVAVVESRLAELGVVPRGRLLGEQR
jgi:hypothetical protein